MADTFVLRSSVPPSELNEVIRAVWNEAIASGEIQLQPTDIPIARRGEGQFGVAETIIIGIAGGVAKDAIEGAWKALIWPRLQAKFGAKIKEPDGPAR